MKYVHYSGEFLSVAGIRWRVEILLDSPADVVGELEFDAEPLTIEWGEESKEVPVCGSTATVNIVSPGDRSYVGLYTEDPTGVRMDVYRNNALYWSGCLDPEFYEEPYSSAKGYTVSLTFSDFGALDRMCYDLTGKQRIGDIINYAIEKAGIVIKFIDKRLISGTAEDGDLLNLMVDSSNFYDEDHEAMSLREVLDGILQPLALRMIQRNCVVCIYDLNGLYNSVTTNRIDWQSTDQMLSVDKVYNNAKITWSPYVLSGAINEGEAWTKTTKFTDAQVKDAINSGVPTFLADGTALHAYHYSQDMDKWEDESDLGFVMLTNVLGEGASLHNPAQRFYKIVPIEDGQDSEGVALRWNTVGNAPLIFGNSEVYIPVPWGANPQWGQSDYLEGTTPGSAMVTFSKCSLPSVSEETSQNIRVTINMLMDPRYNPFEQAPNSGPIESKSEMDAYEAYGNFVYAPFAIRFQPTGSDKIYCYVNRDVERPPVGRGRAITDMAVAKGHWEEDTGHALCYLCWYDVEGRENKSGVTGWKKNRQAINPHAESLPVSLANAPEGQLLPYPPGSGNGGAIWVELLDSPWVVRKCNHGMSEAPYTEEAKVATSLAWLLMELPVVSVERNNLYDKELDTDDVEYTGVLNASAREDIEIDTICGTAKGGIPMARGAFFHPDGRQVHEITRAGRTGQAENLLIGTLYSQFGNRKTKLTGTASMQGEGVVTYTDTASEGLKFMLVGAVENPREDTLSGTWVEVLPDEYEEV